MEYVKNWKKNFNTLSIQKAIMQSGYKMLKWFIRVAAKIQLPEKKPNPSIYSYMLLHDQFLS